MKADLHLHSTASDGRHSPEELVRMAASRGVEVIGITDHDTVDGIPAALEAAKSFPKLRVIPGVEISTDVPHGEVHMLGYFIDYADPGLTKKLAELRNSRKERAQKMIDKLATMGVEIEWERVQEIAGSGSVGRPHLARAMMEKGYVQSTREAFQKFIGREGPAYVEREKMTPEEVVELIVKVGGLPVLAHPADMDNLEDFLPRLQRVGMVGMEVYYDGYNSKTVEYLSSLSSKHNLIALGGSDYHGLDTSTETPLGGVDITSHCVKRFLNMARQKAD